MNFNEVRCKVREWCDNPPWITVLPEDLDQQTLSVDCEAGTLEISNGNSVDLAELGTHTVWSAPAQDPGFTWERWEGEDAGGSADSTIAGFEESWSGAPVDGIPTHPNPSTVSGVETDTRYAQSERGRDDHRLCYWVHNDSDDPWLLEDTDTRAESLRVYASCDCPASLVHERYQTPQGAPYNSQGPFLTLPPGGIVKLTVLIQDPGADFSGFWLRATTPTNETTFNPTTYQNRPTAECEDRPACLPLAEGESTKEIKLSCLDCGGAGDSGLDEAAVQALLPVPSESTPIPDNEVDTAIRTGQIGTSLDYARADHNHPIRRQVHPDWPGVTVNGNLSLTSEIVLDRRSTEEWVEYEVRTEHAVPAGNNWPIVTYPILAGFQQPILTIVNMYRTQTLSFQEDDQPGNSVVFDGAAPVGPYMGIEASHWSSTRGVYFPFRRENDIARWFLTVSALYVRL